MRNLVQKVFLSVLAVGLLFLFCQTSLTAQEAVPGQEGHGGNVIFEVSPDGTEGGGYKFFDMMLFGDAFDPLDQADAPEFINQIQAIEEISPELGEALRLVVRSAIFSFVEPELKDIPPTGESNLDGYEIDEKSQLVTWLTYERKQIAISKTDNLTVQINKSLWESLPSSEARSWLLMHETLWLALKSPVLFQFLNPYASVEIGQAEFDEQTNRWTMPVGSLREVADRSEVVVYLNSQDIPLSTIQISRFTSYFMSTLILEKKIDAYALSNFLVANCPRVHSKTDLTNIYWSYKDYYNYYLSLVYPFYGPVPHGWANTVIGQVELRGGYGTASTPKFVVDQAVLLDSIKAPLSEYGGRLEKKFRNHVVQADFTDESPISIIAKSTARRLQKEENERIQKEENIILRERLDQLSQERKTLLYAQLRELTGPDGILRENQYLIYPGDYSKNMVKINIVFFTKASDTSYENIRVGEASIDLNDSQWTVQVSKEGKSFRSSSWPEIERFYWQRNHNDYDDVDLLLERYTNNLNDLVVEKKIKFNNVSWVDVTRSR